MMTLPPALVAFVTTKVKALGAAVIAAAVVYAWTAHQAHAALTLDGLYGAILGALITGVGVHQLPANRPTAPPPHRSPSKQTVAEKRLRRAKGKAAERGATRLGVILFALFALLAIALGIGHHLFFLLLILAVVCLLV